MSTEPEVARNETVAGPGGGVEARVAKLEAHLEHLIGDLRRLADAPGDITRMKSDLAKLPTREYLGQQFAEHFWWTTAVVALFTAILAVVIKFT